MPIVARGSASLLDDRVRAALDAMPHDIRARFERIVELIRSHGCVQASEALEEELTLAETFLRAHAQAGPTQEQVAARMSATQTAIARLESGRAMPSTRALERFAAATGTRLRIGFEGEEDGAERLAVLLRLATERCNSPLDLPHL